VGIAGLSEIPHGRGTSPQSREEQLRQLIAHADVAMYSAKEAGRNCVKIFSAAMR
jgi:GGDEF domain-containing protein